MDDLAPPESGKTLKVTFKDKQIPLVNFYAENENAEMAAIINSFGRLELFAFKDNASSIFDIKIGDSVIISLN